MDVNDSTTILIQNISRNIYNNQATSISNNTFVVPQINLSYNEILTILKKNIELDNLLYEKKKYNALFITSKTTIEHIFPNEIVKYITDFLPKITKQMVFYCKWCLLDYTEIKINQVINDNRFNLLWYNYDDLNYKWAKDTINDAKIHLSTIQNEKKYFLKLAKYTYTPTHRCAKTYSS
tara:strand:+ start:4551 stop:5087 length:537 start_codon:yes stop_codon:yes gene_type:complete